jgi:putative transposase
VCEEDVYLMELVRYIHLNLIRAGMVKSIKELNRSPWSGHSALIGYVKRDWQDTGYVLSMFGNGGSGKSRYMEFVKNGIDAGRRPELVGGGLIRSLGGWAEVLALRARGERQIFDQRVLGDGEFVEQVLSEMDEQSKENLRIRRKGIDLSLLAKKVCNVDGVSVGELRSGSRRREIVNSRGVFSWLAVRELGYSGAEVARFLGVTTSCVTRAVLSGEEPKVKGYL